STSVRLLLALDNEPLLGFGLQIVELRAETRQVYKGMWISRLARLQPIFRFGEADREAMCREAMCRQVQLHGACTMLREVADALYTGYERSHLVWPPNGI